MAAATLGTPIECCTQTCPDCSSSGGGSGGVVFMSTQLQGHGLPQDVYPQPPIPSIVWSYDDLDYPGARYIWVVETQSWL